MSRQPVSTLVPDVTWAATAPFWEGTADGDLRFPRCVRCGLHQWYPRVLCRQCLSPDFTWEAVAPEGSVYTWTIVRRPFVEGSEVALPFAVVQLQFDAAPGVTFITNLADESQADRLAIGAPTTVTFQEIAPGLHAPYAVLR